MRRHTTARGTTARGDRAISPKGPTHWQTSVTAEELTAPRFVDHLVVTLDASTLAPQQATVRLVGPLGRCDRARLLDAAAAVRAVGVALVVADGTRTD